VWNEYRVLVGKTGGERSPANPSREGKTILKCMSKKHGETVNGTRLNQNKEKKGPRVNVIARRVSLPKQA
jgi:hypothetical protein